MVGPSPRRFKTRPGLSGENPASISGQHPGLACRFGPDKSGLTQKDATDSISQVPCTLRISTCSRECASFGADNFELVVVWLRKATRRTLSVPPEVTPTNSISALTAALYFSTEVRTAFCWKSSYSLRYLGVRYFSALRTSASKVL